MHNPIIEVAALSFFIMACAGCRGGAESAAPPAGDGSTGDEPASTLVGPEGGEGSTGSAARGVSCGATICGKDQVCCVPRAAGEGGLSGSCVDRSACESPTAIAVGCASARDCQGGQVCCAQIDLSGGASSSCQSPCFGATVCGAADECPAGEACVAVPGAAGARVCIIPGSGPGGVAEEAGGGLPGEAAGGEGAEAGPSEN